MSTNDSDEGGQGLTRSLYEQRILQKTGIDLALIQHNLARLTKERDEVRHALQAERERVLALSSVVERMKVFVELEIGGAWIDNTWGKATCKYCHVTWYTDKPEHKPDCRVQEFRALLAEALEAPEPGGVDGGPADV